MIQPSKMSGLSLAMSGDKEVERSQGLEEGG